MNIDRKDFLLVAILIIALVGWTLPRAGLGLGGATNFDTLTADVPASGDNALNVSSTEVIDASGAYVGTIRTSGAVTLTGTNSITGAANFGTGGVRFGASGTRFYEEKCATTSYNLPSIAYNGTTSVPITLTGATTSEEQIYFGGAVLADVSFLYGFAPTTTANTVQMIIQNVAEAVNPGAATFFACYRQYTL